MATSSKPKPRPTYIDPERLYTYEGFKSATGISSTRLRELRLQDVHPEWLQLGRRKFIRGTEAIRLIERAAAL